jgi:predicted ATPase/DNA-binding CsgD family transcriptional regulator
MSPVRARTDGFFLEAMNRPAGEMLSARQAQIATMVVRGKSNREIAKALFVSPRTVDAHIAAIFNKLGIRTRVELVATLLAPRAPGAPALGPDAPPLRSVDTIPSNLPRKLTSFINRDGEIADIVALVEAHQLVTLVGSAGVGKTTTALQVAASMLARFNEGAWFVEFAPVGSGHYLPAAIAQALGVVLPPDGDPLVHLSRDLRTKRTLLVFDNCEHLVEPVGHIVATLLRECRRVKVLVTSRQRLGITGEAAFRLPSLQVPSESTARGFRSVDVMRYAATQLFVERARAIDNRFVVSDENAPAIAEICRRLDGIPLAIELAAARSNILSPEQLRERLTERFHVLTNGNHDAIPRHKTLRALVDWSHDLLDEPERIVLRRLGVFVNGFTLEGATAVAGGDDATRVFDVLTSLIDKSLVLAEAERGALRYRLLESTRVYANEKLAQSGESQSVAERHLRFFRDRFAVLSAATEQTALTADIDEAFASEVEDVRAALDSALARGDVGAGAELLANTGSSWLWLGLQPEVIARYTAYLSALRPEDATSIARLSIELSGVLREANEETRAALVAEQSVAYARKAGCNATLARALAYSNDASRIDESTRNLAEAESFAHRSTRLRLQLLSERALLSGRRGDVDAELQYREELRRQCRALGRTRYEVPNAINLAELEHARGNTTRAIRLAREALSFIAGESVGSSTYRQPRSPLGYTLLLTNLAGYLVAAGDLPEAEFAARGAIEALAGVERHLVRRCAAIEHLALVYALRDDVERAAVLAGYARTVLDRPGVDDRDSASTSHSRLTALLRERLGPPERERLFAAGADLTMEAAVARALHTGDE